MPSLYIKTNDTTISHDENGRICVVISPDENNGLSLSENGEIVVTKGNDGYDGSGGTANIPGNGIAGDVNADIKVLRCNNTVSRKVANDPIPDNEGVLMLGDNGLLKRIRDAIG